MKHALAAALSTIFFGCVGPAPGSGGQPTGRARPFVFAWGEGAVSIQESVERDGEVLSLSWRATVTREGDHLRLSFSETTLVDGFAEALTPGGTHPLYQVMPDLVVDARGVLVAVEGLDAALDKSGKLSVKTRADDRALKAVKTKEQVEARARERWAQWTRLSGFSQPLDTPREEREELTLEDGQKMPVVTTTTHTGSAEQAEVEIVRSFAGPTVTRVYKEVARSLGVPERELASIEKVVREERYEASVEPKTLRATRIRSRELTTEHRTDGKVQLKAAGETWTFVW